jgi:hypothetical protein
MYIWNTVSYVLLATCNSSFHDALERSACSKSARLREPFSSCPLSSTIWEFWLLVADEDQEMSTGIEFTYSEEQYFIRINVILKLVVCILLHLYLSTYNKFSFNWCFTSGIVFFFLVMLTMFLPGVFIFNTLKGIRNEIALFYSQEIRNGGKV